MTPFGESVAAELRSALVAIETASIVDYRHLDNTARALLRNALFYVVPTPAIDATREKALAAAHALAETIRETGIHPQGISLEVDQARAEAVLAFQALIDATADAQVTTAGKVLGVGF